MHASPCIILFMASCKIIPQYLNAYNDALSFQAHV